MYVTIHLNVRNAAQQDPNKDSQHVPSRVQHTLSWKLKRKNEELTTESSDLREQVASTEVSQEQENQVSKPSRSIVL